MDSAISKVIKDLQRLRREASSGVCASPVDELLPEVLFRARRGFMLEIQKEDRELHAWLKQRKPRQLNPILLSTSKPHGFLTRGRISYDAMLGRVNVSLVADIQRPLARRVLNGIKDAIKESTPITEFLDLNIRKSVEVRMDCEIQLFKTVVLEGELHLEQPLSEARSTRVVDVAIFWKDKDFPSVVIIITAVWPGSQRLRDRAAEYMCGTDGVTKCVIFIVFDMAKQLPSLSWLRSGAVFIFRKTQDGAPVYNIPVQIEMPPRDDTGELIQNERGGQIELGDIVPDSVWQDFDTGVQALLDPERCIVPLRFKWLAG